MIASAYNNLISSCLPASSTRYRLHDHRELKQIYQKIVKNNRISPLYMVQLTEDSERYVLNIKEQALSLDGLLDRLKGNDSVFSSIMAVSSDENSVSAQITSSNHLQLPAPFSIKVNHLATPQINIGQEVYSNSHILEEGDYRFTLDVENNIYEFHFPIRTKMDNFSIEKKLAESINHSKSGVTAKIIENSNSVMSHIELVSDNTGSTDQCIFHLTDTSFPAESQGLAAYFGLNQVSTYPSKASFLLNGSPKESMANQFIMNNSLTVYLNANQTDDITISYSPDSDKIIEGMRKFTEDYNYFIELASDNSPSRQNHKLIHNIREISRNYRNQLESCGLNFDDNQLLHIDTSVALQAALDGSAQKLLGQESQYVKELCNLLNEVSINPMNYVNKTIVIYPNYQKPVFTSPYVTSMYSGMLFNGYC